MGKIIKVAEIEQKHPGTGRFIGQIVGEKIEPGDIVDFEGLIATTNSFADQLIIAFLQKHSHQQLRSIKFRNVSPLLKILLKRAIHRRVVEANVNAAQKDSFGRQSIAAVPQGA